MNGLVPKAEGLVPLRALNFHNGLHQQWALIQARQRLLREPGGDDLHIGGLHKVTKLYQFVSTLEKCFLGMLTLTHRWMVAMCRSSIRLNASAASAWSLSARLVIDDYLLLGHSASKRVGGLRPHMWVAFGCWDSQAGTGR